MKNKKKVLFIMQLPPPVHGASAMNETIRASKQINNSFAANYINLTTASDTTNIGKPKAIKFIRSLIIYIISLCKVLKGNYDLVYITLSPHGMAFYKDAILVVLLKLTNTKICFHLHGKGIKKRISNKIVKTIYSFIFKNVSVIHLSKMLYYDIEDLCKKENVYFVANGIEVDTTLKFIPEKHDNRILYLSNMQESKGSLTLLKAAKLLKEEGLDFHMDFVGRWHNNKHFKKEWLTFFKKHNLSGNVTYHGPKYGNEKVEAFSKAKIFVLPTENDCFPLTILEAMYYGCVVVTTNEGAIPEMINNGENGFILTKNNAKELSLLLQKLLKKSSIASKLGGNARQCVEEKYTIGNFEQNLVEVLHKIIHK